MPIFDQGYQHWSGELSGHAWRWLAITRHGVRVGSKNRVLKLLMLTAWAPALALAFMLCLWGLVERQSTAIAPLMQFLSFMRPEILADPRHYRHEIWTISYDFFLMTELRFSMIVVLLVGPSLISQDLRYNALPLYLSRPLRRIDYFLGKLGVIVVFLARVTILPCIIAYVLGLLFSLDLSIVRDTLPLLFASLIYAVAISLSAGLLMLALSSLSRNSRYVALFWLGIWFVSSVVGGILETAEREQRQQHMYRTMRHYDQSPATPAEEMKRRRAWEASWREARANTMAEEARAAKRDWRPLTSYTANLARVGEHLLGTNAAWEKIGKLIPQEERDQFLITFEGPQYPWIWSVGVLFSLLGISVWILTSQVKSLDRLK